MKSYVTTVLNGKADELSGKDFLSLNPNKRDELIMNCLIHSAKMIDTRIKSADAETKENGYDFAFVNGLKESALNLINGQDGDDVKQSAMMYALERATATNYADKPLLYMLSVCTSKALSDQLYGTKKRNATDTIDTETPIAVRFDSTENQAIKACERGELLDYLPKKTAVDVITMLDYMEYGYDVDEIANMMDTTPKTIYQWISAVINAVAIQNAENKRIETARMLVNSKKAQQNAYAHKQAEKAIADILNGCESYHVKRSPLVRKWLNMSYMERIKFMTYNKEKFALIRSEIEKG